VTNEQLSEEIGSLKSQVLEANAMHEDDQQASKEAARTAQDGANEVLKLRAQA
jgi:hypothetical protein